MAKVRLTPIQHAVRFILWLAIPVTIGAMAGAILFPLSKLLFGGNMSFACTAALGAREIGFWAFIWAPGLAVVALFNRLYRERAAQREDKE